MNTPVSTTVLAFDISGPDPIGPAVVAGFERVVALARSLGFVTQDPGNPNLILTLAPDAAVAPVVSQIAAALADFDAASAPFRVRAVVHYGVVFRSETAGQTGFMGSAIRATQSALRRAPGTGSLMATRDFATHAATLPNLPFHLEAMQGAAAADGMSHVLFGAAGSGSSGSGYVLPAADPAFVEFVKRRMATDIGPFAGPLVDRAVRSSTAATQIVALLSKDIENPQARVRFEDEVMQFIKSQVRK